MNAGKVAAAIACCCCVCPGDVIFTLADVSISCHCAGGDITCDCAGSLAWTGGEFTCSYEGGCSVLPCGPIFVSMYWYSGSGWYIDFFFQSDPGSPCAGESFDTISGIPVHFTDSCSPDGTYSLDLYGSSGGTGTVTFTITGP